MTAGSVSSIGKDFNADDCEALISASRSQYIPLLKVATNLRIDARPGGANTVAQANATWARSQEAPVLMPYAEEGDATGALERFCERLHGITGAMLASRISGSDERSDIARETFSLIGVHASAMNGLEFRQLVRGGSLSLVCVDQSTKRFLQPLYSANTDEPRVKGTKDMRALVMRVADVLASQYLDDIRGIANELAGIVHELFANTHDHARADLQGTAYRRSVRSVTFGLRMVPVDTIGTDRTLSPRLREYLGAVAKWVGTAKRVKMFEVSVLDSGPGMAARFKGAELALTDPIEAELGLVNQCFLKRSTTRSTPSFGSGLPRVLAALKLAGGMIQVRTGRLSLFRSFDPDPRRREGLIAEDAILFDMDRNDRHPTLKGAAAGTKVTILLPFGLRTE